MRLWVKMMINKKINLDILKLRDAQLQNANYSNRSGEMNFG
jgi:hypothetical protein